MNMAMGMGAAGIAAKMTAQTFMTRSPEETVELGRTIASELQPPALVLLL